MKPVQRRYYKNKALPIIAQFWSEETSSCSQTKPALVRRASYLLPPFSVSDLERLQKLPQLCARFACGVPTAFPRCRVPFRSTQHFLAIASASL